MEWDINKADCQLEWTILDILHTGHGILQLWEGEVSNCMNCLKTNVKKKKRKKLLWQKKTLKITAMAISHN